MALKDFEVSWTDEGVPLINLNTEEEPEWFAIGDIVERYKSSLVGITFEIPINKDGSPDWDAPLSEHKVVLKPPKNKEAKTLRRVIVTLLVLKDQLEREWEDENRPAGEQDFVMTGSFKKLSKFLLEVRPGQK